MIKIMSLIKYGGATGSRIMASGVNDMSESFFEGGYNRIAYFIIKNV